MNRTVEQWAACDPDFMARQSEAAIMYALRDAKNDIAQLSATLKRYDAHNIQLASRVVELEDLSKNWQYTAESMQIEIHSLRTRLGMQI